MPDASQKSFTAEERRLLKEADEASDRAYTFYKQGKHAEAEKEVRAALAIRLRVLGPEHLDTLDSRNNLAASLQPQATWRSFSSAMI